MLTLAIGVGLDGQPPGDFSHFSIAREYKIGATAYYDTFTVDPDTLVMVNGGTNSWWWYDTGLTNGRQYKYRVFLVDTLGNVGDPAPQVTQTPYDNTPPAVPTDLVASGGAGFVDLDWSSPSTPADFLRFRVWRALGEGAFALHDSVTISAHQDSTAVSGQDYRYYIVALDDDDNASAPSDTATGGWIGSPPATYLAPQNVRAISNHTATNTAVVIYPPTDVTGLTSFTVYRGSWNGFASSLDTTACTVYKRGLAPDGYNGHIFLDPFSKTSPDSAFQYTAVALYSGNRSVKYSPPAGAFTDGGFAATTPTLGAFGNGTNILLLVGGVAGADSTRVYRGTSAGTQTSLASINALDNPYTDTTAAANTDYWYKVRQYDVQTASWSNYSTVSGPVRWNSVPSGNPSISGVNEGVDDTVQHGESVVIAGANFGFKSPAAPLIWETFESGSNGQLVRDVVGWQPYSENRGGAIYSTLLSHGGANSVYSDALVYGDYFGSNKATVEGAHDILFSSCWWRTNNVTVGDDRGLIKLTRFSTTENWYQGRGVPFISGMSAGSGGGGSQSPQVGYYNSSAVEVYTNVGPGGAYLSAPFNAWTRIDLASQLSTAGASDGWIWGAITGPTSRSVKAGYSIATRGSGQTFQFKGILLPTMSTNQYAATPYGDYQLYCDDVYVDNTLARVEIGNASTYEACTHLEIQIPSAWTATSVTIEANTGSFDDTEPVYLFVIDADGTPSPGQLVDIDNP